MYFAASAVFIFSVDMYSTHSFIADADEESLM
ncbi:hypothetical protein ABID08_000695 [Rhizobium binae]|uniref:Uncharacterized protein n=1 Tax=Rhizobium binae TaxID=1138190 RepID=A0ABV2MAD6_9HYPH